MGLDQQLVNDLQGDAVIDHAGTHEPGGDDVAKFVFYGGAQTLTDSEKAQARTNMGASATAVDSLTGTSTAAALAANQGRNLDNIKMAALTLLWINGSPSSNFAAQTISLALSAYDAVVIEVAAVSKASANGDMLVFVSVGQSAEIYMPYYRNQHRGVTANTSGVAFATGQIYATYNTNTTTDTTAAIIPMRIYGIKHLYVD